MPTIVTLRGPTLSCQRPPMTAPQPTQKIATANAQVVVWFDQLKLAINGCVNELHEYTVPRQIITRVPAAAISQRLGVAVSVDISPTLKSRAQARTDTYTY
jgi:hypothetical protein